MKRIKKPVIGSDALIKEKATPSNNTENTTKGVNSAIVGNTMLFWNFFFSVSTGFVIFLWVLRPAFAKASAR